jgi:hypothetical protein
MVRVYCRCNGGDYFLGEYCPFDGWSSPKSKEIVEATERLRREGITPSVAALRSTGLSQKALARTLIIEYGSEASAFEALTPQLYVLEGRTLEPKDWPAGLA